MTATNEYWVHNWSPFLIEFPENALGIKGIPYYGLSYLLGFLAAWLLLRAYDKRNKLAINADQRASLMTYIMVGVMAGGRLGYMLLYDLEAFLADPMLFFRVQQGGMASHGGFVGVILAVALFCRWNQFNFFKLGDALVSVAPLGILFGRCANFINGELWGRVTNVSWAVIFPESPKAYNPLTQSYGPEPRHPSQLYAALLEGALMFGYVQWRYWKFKTPPGQLAGEFFIGYGIVRIFGELFREPDAPEILGITRGQFYSTFMILGGAALIFWARKIANARNASK
ncbi:MAG: prolipoprotein diacylglyceryl transferase [Coraliomargarita sp.]